MKVKNLKHDWILGKQKTQNNWLDDADLPEYISENSVDLKLETAGSGGESIEMSEDGGFIIGTLGSTIVKTDKDLNF